MESFPTMAIDIQPPGLNFHDRQSAVEVFSQSNLIESPRLGNLSEDYHKMGCLFEKIISHKKNIAVSRVPVILL